LKSGLVYYCIVLNIFASMLALPAGSQTPRPAAVAQKMADMDSACRVAGGRPGGGTYVFVQDFSGDGGNDFLISEGNYNCIGKPDVFARVAKRQSRST
jgi:hypothetical protein